MDRRNIDPEYDPEEIRDEDPVGEQAFAEQGFQDADDGGPVLEAPGLETEEPRRTESAGQKVAGVPEDRQKEPTASSPQRPDTTGAVIRERGGAGKGDPAVGGTRPD